MAGSTSSRPCSTSSAVEDRIRPDHPLRDVKRRVDAILAGMYAQFAAAYSPTGRPSVPPERLLKALLLMALYSVRSERQLCERIDTDLLFRWFLDLQPSDEAFDPTTFTHNRDRLDEHRLTQAFFDAVVGEAIAAGLCSEHFSVDGTLIESFAVGQELPARSGERRTTAATRTASSRGTRRWISTGEKRTNDTHQSRTDPEARLYRKSAGQEAKLSHMGHAAGREPARADHGGHGDRGERHGRAAGGARPARRGRKRRTSCGRRRSGRTRGTTRASSSGSWSGGRSTRTCRW